MSCLYTCFNLKLYCMSYTIEMVIKKMQAIFAIVLK